MARLADNLKRHRQQRGWSQRALARRAGVALSTVQGAEGAACTTVTTVELLARALGMKPGFLAWGED
jgi:transcriptional regulator with XRE-family HTH domain